MVGASTDRLYEIAPDTGAATAVGSADVFGTPGGGVNHPSGLASHGTVLYMTGTSTGSLYTLDTVTGVAANVGALTGEGITENSPQGIASRTDVFSIDPSTGTITYTGSPAAAGTEYTLQAQASDHRNSDGGGTSNVIDATIPITITVVNPPPPPPNQGNPSGSQTPPPGNPSNTQTPGDQSDSQTPGDPPDSQTPGDPPDSQTPGDPPDSQTPGDPSDTQPQPPSRFTDIENLTHAANIDYIVTAGITLGCDRQGTRYCPNDPVTRAQMASFLARALKLSAPDDPTVGVFRDVGSNNHRDNIRAIAAVGITLGCDKTGDHYCPDRFVTRAAMASFLARAFKLPAPDDPTIGVFSDVQSSNNHRDNIRAIAAAGITLGCDKTGDRYCPDRFVTRAEMASFLARALQHTTNTLDLPEQPGAS